LLREEGWGDEFYTIVMALFKHLLIDGQSALLLLFIQKGELPNQSNVPTSMRYLLVSSSIPFKKTRNEGISVNSKPINEIIFKSIFDIIQLLIIPGF
jgi:hypothetical protein